MNSIGWTDAELRESAEKSNEVNDAYKRGYEQARKEFERPQSEWVVVPERCFICCKECGHVKPFSAEEFKLGINVPNFCEECGADMKGGAK